MGFVRTENAPPSGPFLRSERDQFQALALAEQEAEAVAERLREERRREDLFNSQRAPDPFAGMTPFTHEDLQRMQGEAIPGARERPIPNAPVEAGARGPGRDRFPGSATIAQPSAVPRPGPTRGAELVTGHRPIARPAPIAEASPGQAPQSPAAGAPERVAVQRVPRSPDEGLTPLQSPQRLLTPTEYVRAVHPDISRLPVIPTRLLQALQGEYNGYVSAQLGFERAKADIGEVNRRIARDVSAGAGFGDVRNIPSSIAGQIGAAILSGADPKVVDELMDVGSMVFGRTAGGKISNPDQFKQLQADAISELLQGRPGPATRALDEFKRLGKDAGGDDALSLTDTTRLQDVFAELDARMKAKPTERDPDAGPIRGFLAAWRQLAPIIRSGERSARREALVYLARHAPGNTLRDAVIEFQAAFDTGTLSKAELNELAQLLPLLGLPEG